MRFLTSVPARRRVVCVRDRRVCAFSIVRCLDVSCAFAVTYLSVRSRRVCAFTSVRVQPSCVRVHERACASTSRVRVRRVRVDTSVMDLRSISGRGCLSPTFNHSEWPLARQTSVANNATIAFEDV